MAHTFGTVQMPPPSLLPAAVAKAVEAFGEARRASGKAQAELGNHRRTVLPRARERDVEASADAIESGGKDPGPKFERQAQDKLADLERAAEAAAVVERRAGVRMREKVEASLDEIREDAAERMATAKAAFMQAASDVEAATADLVVASALSTWANDPGACYKERGIRAVRLQRTADEPTVDVVIQALREVIEPRERLSMPSPFGGAIAVEPTPAA